MRIAATIARVRKGVKKGGLPAVVAQLSAPLRSEAIPARLRPAASRLADLLTVAQPEPVKVVSLSEAAAQAHAEGRSAGGVCPFTGMRTGMSMGDEASAPSVAEEPAHAPEIVAAAEQPEVAAAEVAAVEPEPAVATAVAAEPEQARVSEPEPAIAAEVAVVTAAPEKEQHADKEKVAGKPATANTSARSNARPAGKRPSAKAKKK